MGEVAVPAHKNYLDVYDAYQLTGRRSVFAHCLHLEEEEWDCLHKTDSAVAFCPTSNLFLGSGLFDLNTCWQKGVKMGMGTDVGAGTTFSMLQTLGEAYKVGQLQRYKLAACEAFYHATLGGAHALDLDSRIGNFSPGKEADFVVLDPAVSALQQMAPCQQQRHLGKTLCADDAGRRSQYRCNLGKRTVRLADTQ